MSTPSCGQFVIMGLPGAELTDGLRSLIRQVQPGGYILFTRNLASPEQTFELIRELYSLSDLPPVVTIDQEGGRVSRLKVIGQEPPSARELASAGSTDLCRHHGELTGKLLASLGFNLDLAPVVDYCVDEEADNSLRGRCYGETPELVIERASAFLEGMQQAGVKGTAKHFPGYTFCEKDPHGDLPVIRRTRAELEANELKVFRHFLPKAEAMMIGHGHFTAFHDESLPASLSPKLIGDLLRKEMDYKGIIMTDDLEMGAIADRYGSAEASRRAIRAGNDMLLICHNPACVEIAADALNALPAVETAASMERVAAFRKSLLRIPEKFDRSVFDAINEEIASLRVAIRGK